MSLSSSGLREENITGWPALTHRAPIVPPILPAPMTPMGRLACANRGWLPSAAANAPVPAAASKTRRETLENLAIEASLFPAKVTLIAHFRNRGGDFIEKLAPGRCWCLIGFAVICLPGQAMRGEPREASLDSGGRPCRARTIVSGPCPGRRFRSFREFGRCGGYRSHPPCQPDARL